MTESPLMKSLGMKRSLLTGVEPFLPLPVLGICRNMREQSDKHIAALQRDIVVCLRLLNHIRGPCRQQQLIYERGKHLTSVHISFTFSRIMLQCLSNAFTLPRSFLLFLQFISTCAGQVSVRSEA